MLDGMPPLEREWVEEQAAILNGNYTQGLDDHLVVGMLLVSEPREITPMTRLDDEFMPVGTDRAQCRRILRAAHFWFPVETPCSGRHPAAKLGAGESQHFLRSISHQMCHDATAPENECGLPAAEILEAWAREGPIAAELGTETFCDQIVNLAIDGKLRNLIKTFQTPRGAALGPAGAAGLGDPRGPAAGLGDPSGPAAGSAHAAGLGEASLEAEAKARQQASVADTLRTVVSCLQEVCRAEQMSAPSQQRIRGALADLECLWDDIKRGRADAPPLTGTKVYAFSWTYKLDCIHFSDQLKGQSHVAQALELARRISMHPRLMDSVSAPAVPSQAVMCKSAVDLDLFTMVFARDFVFFVPKPHLAPRTIRLVRAGDFNGHLRADSSPQFGRDILVMEIDIFRSVGADLGHSCFSKLVWQNVKIEKRLMVMQQIGQRAGKFPDKLKKLRNSLWCEAGGSTEQFDYIRRGIVSILFDCGVESGLATAPALGPPRLEELGLDPQEGAADDDLIDVQQVGSFCPLALPIPDHDHGMHHTMEEVRDYFDFEETVFEPTKAFAKYFSHQGRMTFFKAHAILKNPHLSADEKDEMMDLFNTLCPQWVEHRWQYQLDVFTWQLKRRSAIIRLWALIPAFSTPEDRAKHESSFTDKEKAAIDRITSGDAACADYWMKVYCLEGLCRWGGYVRGWLHGCFCHQTQLMEGRQIECCHKGRNASLWAGSKQEESRLQIASMPVPKEALEILVDHPELQGVISEFVGARNSIAHRFQLFFGFWHKLPWAIVKLYEAEIDPRAEVKARVVVTAGLLVQLWRDRGTTWYGEVGARFLDPQHPTGIQIHILALSKRYVMSPTLAAELHVYASSLLVMQGLESRHHLARMYLEVARSAKLPAVCASMRRMQNPDTRDPRFRLNLDSYARRVSELVPSEARGQGHDLKHDKPKMYGMVYGCSAHSMHASTQREAAAINAFRASIARPEPLALEGEAKLEENFICEYVRGLLPEGEMFLLGGDGGASPGDVGTDVLIFQMVALHPERKATIERISHMSEITWERGLLGISVAKLDPVRGAAAGDGDGQFFCDLSMAGEPLSLTQFYNDGWHKRLYAFQESRVQEVFENTLVHESVLSIEDDPDAAAASAIVPHSRQGLGSDDLCRRVGDVVVSAPGLDETTLAERLPGISARALGSMLERMTSNALIERTPAAAEGRIYHTRKYAVIC